MKLRLGSCRLAGVSGLSRRLWRDLRALLLLSAPFAGGIGIFASFASEACGPPPVGYQGAGRMQTLPAPQTGSDDGGGGDDDATEDTTSDDAPVEDSAAGDTSDHDAGGDDAGEDAAGDSGSGHDDSGDPSDSGAHDAAPAKDSADAKDACEDHCG